MSFDVIIIGGGPMGLSAAWQCVQRGKTVLVLERSSFGNEFGSSPGFSRQFRTCYSELHLCKLAVETSPMWDTLEKQLGLGSGSLLDRTGCLWFGDGSINTSEGNIVKAMQNLKTLGQPYEELEGMEITNRFPFIAGAVADIKRPKALYLEHDGGTINVPELFRSFVRNLKKQTCELVDKACVNSIDYTSRSGVIVSTDKGQQYRGKKIILTPGTHVNHVLSTLKPLFTERINLVIYLWSSTYFKVHASVPDSSMWPIWYFFGKPQSTDDDDTQPIDYNSYYGFPSDENDHSFHARVAPAFTSQEKFNFNLYPPADDKRPVDRAAVTFTSNFVQKSMSDLECTLQVDKMSTCVAGFAEMVEGEDDSAGFVLDFVPCTNDRIVLFTGGWGMKYVPLMGVILADLAIDGETKYRCEIEPMNIKRGILVPAEDPQKFQRLTTSERCAKFNKIWS